MSSLASTIKTPRHHDANRPFGAVPMIKEPVKPTDPSTLEICNDPLPSHRASCGNKYEATIKAMKMGQAIKCLPSEVGRVAGALRKFVENTKIAANVRTIKDYGDGKGRVWLLAVAEPKAALKSVKG